MRADAADSELLVEGEEEQAPIRDGGRVKGEGEGEGEGGGGRE